MNLKKDYYNEIFMGINYKYINIIGEENLYERF